jgi:hypothetical protein
MLPTRTSLPEGAHRAPEGFLYCCGYDASHGVLAHPITEPCWLRDAALPLDPVQVLIDAMYNALPDVLGDGSHRIPPILARRARKHIDTWLEMFR